MHAARRRARAIGGRKTATDSKPLLVSPLYRILTHCNRYLGPAVLLQAFRWISDSRDARRDG